MDSLTSFSTSAFCLSKHRVASLWLLGCPFPPIQMQGRRNIWERSLGLVLTIFWKICFSILIKGSKLCSPNKLAPIEIFHILAALFLFRCRGSGTTILVRLGECIFYHHNMQLLFCQFVTYFCFTTKTYYIANFHTKIKGGFYFATLFILQVKIQNQAFKAFICSGFQLFLFSMLKYQQNNFSQQFCPD